MKYKINKNVVYHYLLIYFMLILNQSMISRLFLKPYNTIIIVILSLFVILKYRKFHLETFFFFAFLLFSVFVVRIISNNGIGLESWISWVLPILSVYLAIIYDKKFFLSRFIKLVVFLSMISLIGYFVTLIYPNILKLLLLSYDSGRSWEVWDMESSIIYNFKGYGLFFYSFIDNGMNIRNLGIYTEPGIYQMVLNTSLFILVFWNDKLTFTQSQIQKYIFIILITIISCQSTTGYMGMVCILLIAFLTKKNIGKKVKRNIMIVALILLFIIIVDYVTNKQNSILHSVLINKLFDVNGNFSLSSTSSGNARVGTILITLQSMITNPFGIGTVETSRLLDYANTGNVGAAIMTIGSSLGVIPFLTILSWMFVPIFKNNDLLIVKILLVFLYFNTALAQSSAFYPTLVLIPMWIYLVESKYRNHYIKIS